MARPEGLYRRPDSGYWWINATPSSTASAYAKALGLKVEKTRRRCLPSSSSTPTEDTISESSPSDLGKRP